MKSTAVKDNAYYGFEQGPIRPPSEAGSLLIRVTRNCPWNHCTFCPVYKGSSFSIRPVDHVIADIDAVHRHVDALKTLADGKGQVLRHQLVELSQGLNPDDHAAFNAALNWFATGMQSIFIQDANSLIIKPPHMLQILMHLRNRFPWVERITSYARSHTIARITDEFLLEMRMAGLNRIHIGLESGSDKVLKRVKKGVDKKNHIKAGIKVEKSGIQLSEYVMPGLGGKALSTDHALETADALSQIDPDFIRLRTLAVPDGLALHDDRMSGKFEKCNDIEMVQEIRLFLENLHGITSQVKSDHILNLFQEIDGRLPEDLPDMIRVLDIFLEMPPDEQTIFQVGRRMGILSRLEDMGSSRRRARVEEFCSEHDVTSDNVDEMIDEMMTRFI